MTTSCSRPRAARPSGAAARPATRLTTNPRGTQGQAGTTADFFSFSMASTMARTPFSVDAISGVFAEVPDISETM